MISLHHTHLMASDIEATISFWREHFGAELVFDAEFAGARNVFLRIGEGRLHLYSQAPKQAGPATVHHLGLETDELHDAVRRLKAAGVSVSNVRELPEAAYAMVQGPDGLLIELFQVDQRMIPGNLRKTGYFANERGSD